MLATMEVPACSGARGRRGGILITALIFSAIIALIALPSYLALSRHTLKISHRGFYNIAVVDLAETGLEHALWSVNTGDWSGWDTAGEPGNARRKFSGFEYSGGVTGEVAVHVSGYSGQGATAVAKATITLADGGTLEKWAKVTMKGRSLFAYGLLVREGLTASGGSYFDSWISDPDNDPSTPGVAYSAANRRDNAAIASVSTATPSISIGSADIYGTVSVGANSSAGLAMSWGGQVGPRGMAANDAYNLAPGALKTGFTATFDYVTAPTTTNVVDSYTLPYFWDDPSTAWNDNIYVSGQSWDNPNAPKPGLGTTGATTIVQMNKLSVKANALLTVRGDVILILPPSGQTTFEVIEGGALKLDTGASLTVYTPGNIKVTGGASAGVIGNASPHSFQIWSTRPEGSIGQTITLEGSGKLNAVIYAPEAELTVPGGTELGGAAVVRRATFSGSGAFHYDESLKNMNFGSSGSTGVESYSELDTPSERAPYANLFNF